MIKDIFTSKDLANFLGINQKTIYAWNFRGKLPEPDMIHGRQMYWTRESAEKILKDFKAGELDIRRMRKRIEKKP